MRDALRRLPLLLLLGGVVVVCVPRRISFLRPAHALGQSTPRAVAAQPLEKTLLGLDVPPTRGEFTVSADGKHTYFPYGGAYYVFNESGDLVHRMAIKGGGRGLALLPNGRFLNAQSGAGGHIALLSPDGVELAALVTQGKARQQLRRDTTGWTTPFGLAFDAIHQLIFVPDTTAGAKGAPDPDWSRIAEFDMNGKFVREFAAYDSSLPGNDEHRTWYDDIEVDPKRSLVYVTARAPEQLWVFEYGGEFRGRVPGVAGIAVFPDGRVAVGDPDKHHLRIYDSALHLVKTLVAEHVAGLEADAAGSLYATIADSAILYLRWPPNLTEPRAVHPVFQRISVEIPFDSAIEGKPFDLFASISSRPTVPDAAWRVFARPSDGSVLRWRELESSYSGSKLTVTPPTNMLGLHDIAVRYGKGGISEAELGRDLHVEKTIHFKRATESGSVAIRSMSNRSGFRQGEPIAVRIFASGSTADGALAVTLRRAGLTLASSSLPTGHGSYWEIPVVLSRRLLPGSYVLEATSAGVVSQAYTFDLAPAERDSPMQRLLYHEFDGNPATEAQARPGAPPAQLSFVRDYVDEVAALGFTRETDRSAHALGEAPFAGMWRADTTSQPTEHDFIPRFGNWEPELYLDRATARGISYDSQLLAHCSPVRLADAWFPELNANLQRVSQRLGRYPAFYGFNYNDEMFFGGMSAADDLWLNAEEAKHPQQPKADAFRAGLDRMYGEFDHAVEEIRPDLARTATPMWQFPAVEGSYAPTVYAKMTESYSHYLSEGYGWPFYPAHSAEILRRPGKPLMAVFDGDKRSAGEAYLKDALQVLGRGVQGVGTEHLRPFVDAPSADSMAVMNDLARMYGSIFAQAQPDNEAAVLYSYAQDVTEKRDAMGTPHWERVLALHGAGLMAGLPTTILYEEDVRAGALLEAGKPKVPLLFLVGQTAPLPSPVATAIRAFAAAGGRVAIDADSAQFPGAVRFPSSLLGPSNASRSALNGDGLFPAMQPAYETIASALKAQFGSTRRFPVDTDDPWIGKNRFDAGAIHYVLISTETSPFGWSPGQVWGLGAGFSKAYLPKRTNLTVPTAPAVYDVFERQLVRPTAERKGMATLAADLTVFPGKLYAFAPHPLDAPKLSARVGARDVSYTVNVGVRARVPLRVTLKSPRGSVATMFRASDDRGEFSQVMPRPLFPEALQLEVTELLGGRTSSLTISASEPCSSLLRELPQVETEHDARIRELMKKPQGTLRVTGAELLPSQLRGSLAHTLETAGVHATFETTKLSHATPGLNLMLATTNGKGLPDITQAANQRGLFGRYLGEVYPGAGRGFIGVAFAAREYRENCVAVVGGDEQGLEASVRRLMALLGESASTLTDAAELTQTVQGAQAEAASIPKLSDRVGARLSDVRASNGKLVVSARGFLANLARVDDAGDHGELIAVARVGESPTTTSLFVSDDGQSYGVAARTVQRFGEGFSLFNGASPPQVFASFGDAPPFQHSFSASANGATVLAPGPYGVVAWRHERSGWSEVWSNDYWKTFDALDWPVAGDAARIPSFDTIIPKRSDLALVAFGEFTNNNWIQNQASSTAEVSALSLSSGARRWTFRAPVASTLIFPTLYSNDDGSLVLLQAQLGAYGRASYRYYALDSGRESGTWATETVAQSVALSERTKRIAVAYGDGSRLLEERAADGTVLYSQTWHSQPLALAFADDGASVFVSDEAGFLSRLDAKGAPVWQVHLGCSAKLSRDGTRLYAAGWDGRLRAFTLEGHEQWSLDLTPQIASGNVGTSTREALVHEPARNAQTSALVPEGPNLLRSSRATLTVGGTRGWGSWGKVQVTPADLTNGMTAEVTTPWIPSGELYWDGVASRKVWAEVDFKVPTTVSSLTVYENSSHPEAWPSESLVQLWDTALERWKTVRHAAFLRGPVNTYTLDAKRVTKLRYVPWNNYFHNFYTSEIEVR